MNTAKLIFLKGLSREKSCQAGFRKDFLINDLPGDIVLKITGRTFYRVFLNGEFLFHGPARSAHKHARIDKIDITGKVVVGNNSLAVEVAGYNDPNIYTTGEYSYIMAEIEAEGRVIVATDESWEGFHLKHRRSNVEKFSHARCINEIYDLDWSYFEWRSQKTDQQMKHMVEIINDSLILLERAVKNPDFSILKNAALLSVSNSINSPDIEVPLFEHMETPEYLNRLDEQKIERPAVECCRDVDIQYKGIVKFNNRTGIKKDIVVESENDTTSLEFDFDTMSSAFIGLEFSCMDDTIVDLVHGDRLNRDGTFNPRACASNCAIRLHVKAGRIRFESFEPYSIRYLKVIIRNSKSFIIHDVFLRRYQYPDLHGGSFLCSDGELNRVYTAARDTLCISTLDVFMDCPGRERAGFLCDSLWSARAARMMLGDTSVNKAMLENFLIEPVNEELKDYFPTCYPSKNASDVCIPNWALFLVLQVREYYIFTGDRDFIELHKKRIEKIINSFETYENKDGLLENLPGWLFIDWSAANLPEYVNPVSVPTNALYARALECAGELLNNHEWRDKAANIRRLLKKYAVNKEKFISGSKGFFSDNLFYDANGNIIPGKSSSEASQYYCAWLDIMDRNEYPYMAESLIKEFGLLPERYPADLSLARANLFIALFIRYECLAKWGEYRRLVNEIRGLFSYMLDNGPGTFWESLSDFTSTCHGFTSHAGVWLMRDILGLGIPDEVEKNLTIAPHPCGLRWAKGSINTNHGVASIKWSLEDDLFEMVAAVPEEYAVRLEIPEEIRSWRNISLNSKAIPTAIQSMSGIKGSFILAAKRG